MKKYMITINGKQYEVAVEEIRDGSQNVGYQTPLAGIAPNPIPIPKITPAIPPTPTPNTVPKTPTAAPKAPSGAAANNNAITAPMPGKILSLKVKPGEEVKKGQVLLILEAMKMENEIISPRDATVKEINVAEGTSVDTGTPLITLS